MKTKSSEDVTGDVTQRDLSRADLLAVNGTSLHPVKILILMSPTVHHFQEKQIKGRRK